MANPTETQQYILARQPKEGLPTWTGADPNFKLVTTKLPELKPGEVLVKTLYLSNDPAQRGWISANIDPERLYVPPVQAGSVMRAGGVAQVLDGNGTALKTGAKVQIGTLGWTQYAVVPASSCTEIDETAGLSASTYIGALGSTGLTAYYGLMVVGECKAADAVVVSGAAGAVGALVVQLAKRIAGCRRVVGIAGTDDKCRWVESLGADVCVNYKRDDYLANLKRATEGLVDLYFDNVAGATLDYMLTRMKPHGRIAACGGISGYNDDTAPVQLVNYMQIVFNRLQVRGFIVLDYVHKKKEVTQILLQGVKDGKLVLGGDMETVVETEFGDIPKTWSRLFEGGNRGKLITALK